MAITSANIVRLRLTGDDMYETAYRRLSATMVVRQIEWLVGSKSVHVWGQSTGPLNGYSSITCSQEMAFCELPETIRQALEQAVAITK